MRKFWRIFRWFLLFIALLVIAGLYYATKAGLHTFDQRFADALAVHATVYRSLGDNVEKALPDSLIAPLEETIRFLEMNETALDESPSYPILLSDLYLLYANDLGIRLRYQEAIDYYLESEKQIKRASAWYPFKTITLGNLNNLLHLAYGNIGEFLKAEEHITTAVEYFEAAGDEKWVAMSRMNLARINSLQGDYEKAIKNTDLSIEAFSKIQMNHTDSTFLISAYRRRASDYAILASLAEDRGATSQKEEYTEQAREAGRYIIDRKDWFNAEEQTYQWPLLIQDIALHWLNSPLRVYSSDIEAMLEEVEEGLEKSVRPGVDPYRATHQILKAELLLTNGHRKEAITEIRNGLKILGYPADDNWVIVSRDNSQSVVVTALMIYNRLLPTLLEKSDKKALLAAQLSVVETIQQAGKYISGDVSQATQTNQERSIYAGTIRTALQLWESDAATAVNNINFLAECQRAQILQRNLQRVNLADQMEGSEQVWLRKDEALKKKLGDFYAKLSRTENDAEITNLELQINAVKRERAVLQLNPPEGIREGFFRLFALPQIPSLVALRSEMSQGEALVQFIELNQTLLVMTITKDTLDIFETAPFTNWSDDLNDLKLSLNEDKGTAFFTRAARSIYNICLAPTLDSLPNGIEQLTIITDGPLRALDLGVCLRRDKEGESYKEMDYLINDFSINYEYLLGTHFDHLREEIDLDREEEMMVCAPKYETTLTQCQPTNQIESLHQLALDLAEKNPLVVLGGTTKTGVREKSITTKNIFFAAHGVINEENPIQSYLLLSADDDNDCRLAIGEIMNWTFPGTDVILGSCTTEAGKNVRGSGVLSIAQAMTVAGARSLIANTDYIKDGPASKLFHLYFQFREQGLPKNQALKEAKSTYLTEVEDEITPPMFWANTILIGHKD